jgi:hypothetical protein
VVTLGRRVGAVRDYPAHCEQENLEIGAAVGVVGFLAALFTAIVTAGAG